MRLLEYYLLDIEGKHAVVVGRSPILGKPMAMMLLNKNATVTICHSRTKELESHIRSADIIVGAVGIPKFIQGNCIKEGTIVLMQVIPRAMWRYRFETCRSLAYTCTRGRWSNDNQYINSTNRRGLRN